MMQQALAFGVLLRRWRVRRRMTQMDLAIAADSSTRHLSCLETGRSRGSREMVLDLCEQLAIPPRDRNTPFFGGWLRASVPGALAQRTGDRTGSNRTHCSGAFAISRLRPGSPLECRLRQWRAAPVVRRVLIGVAAKAHLRCSLAAASAWEWARASSIIMNGAGTR